MCRLTGSASMKSDLAEVNKSMVHPSFGNCTISDVGGTSQVSKWDPTTLCGYVQKESSLEGQLEQIRWDQNVEAKKMLFDGTY